MARSPRPFETVHRTARVLGLLGSLVLHKAVGLRGVHPEIHHRAVLAQHLAQLRHVRRPTEIVHLDDVAPIRLVHVRAVGGPLEGEGVEIGDLLLDVALEAVEEADAGLLGALPFLAVGGAAGGLGVGDVLEENEGALAGAVDEELLERAELLEVLAGFFVGDLGGNGGEQTTAAFVRIIGR